MEVRYCPTEVITVIGLDRRSSENLAWCAVTYGASRLFWIDGYLICAEVYDKSFEQEMENREFTITHLCYSRFPRYCRVLEVEKGTHIPIVKVDDLKMFRELLKLIKEDDGKREVSPCSGKTKSEDTEFTSNKGGNNQISV